VCTRSRRSSSAAISISRSIVLLRRTSVGCAVRTGLTSAVSKKRRKSAALNPIMGADKVARFFIGLANKNAGRDISIKPIMINGTVGALVYADGELDHSLSVAIDGERIAAIYIVRNPDKLRHVPAFAQQ